MGVAIQRYWGGHDNEIAHLILSIQNGEAGLALTLDDQPDLLDIPTAYASGGFWVALDEGKVIGSIGLIKCGSLGILKKLFVHARYRGRLGVAKALLELLLDHARKLGLQDIMLDTPAAAARAHAFYAKSGFVPISAEALPSNYKYVDRDSHFFLLRLGQKADRNQEL
jgi:predicted N-acetyltransferase YhbS